MSKSKWLISLAALVVLAMPGPVDAQPYAYVLGKVPGRRGARF